MRVRASTQDVPAQTSQLPIAARRRRSGCASSLNLGACQQFSIHLGHISARFVWSCLNDRPYKTTFRWRGICASAEAAAVAAERVQGGMSEIRGRAARSVRQAEQVSDERDGQSLLLSASHCVRLEAQTSAELTRLCSAIGGRLSHLR